MCEAIVTLVAGNVTAAAAKISVNGFEFNRRGCFVPFCAVTPFDCFCCSCAATVFTRFDGTSSNRCFAEWCDTCVRSSAK